MRQPLVPAVLLFGLAVLVVGTAGIAPAVTASDGGVNASLSVVSENGTVEHLHFPSDRLVETERTTSSSDLSSTLALERTKVSASIDEQNFVRAFETAANDSQRLAVVETTIDHLVDRGEELRENRNRAVEQFNRDELTTRQLLTRLVVSRTASLEIRDRIDRLESLARETQGFSLPPDTTVRLDRVRAQLVSLDGPVTDRSAAAFRGERDSQPIYLETAETGITIADIEGDTYVREATNWSARVENEPNQFAGSGTSPLAAAHQRAQEVYPWAFDNQVSIPSISGYGDTAIYPVVVNHVQGELETYFDGRTTDVFYERQRLRASSLPSETIAVNRTDSVTVRVNATTAIGPVSVHVTEPDAKAPAPATVSAGEETLGSTGGDGELWLAGVERTETLTVRTNDGDVATVSLSG